MNGCGRLTTVSAVLLLGGMGGCSQESAHSSVTLLPPQGQTRVIDFETDEGTWMSVDVSPDGRWIVFDLLGQVYRMPIAGGDAECLTQNSGPALNFHPAYSPDGARIAFVSDRGGQNNVWIMNADGGDPQPVLVDPDTRFTDPDWAPDGRSIVAVRVYPTPGRGWHRQTMAIWALPLDGSDPKQLLGRELTHYDAPSFSPDGRHLYVHASFSIGDGLGLLTAGHRILRLDVAGGDVENVRLPGPAGPDGAYQGALRRAAYAGDVPGDEPAALVPEVSPDGRHVAFARELPGDTFTYRGHAFGPSTALYLRDLQTGEERELLAPATKDLTQVNAQYGYRVFPGYAWAPDGRTIILSAGGKIGRLDATTGQFTVIPFTARVRRTLSEQVRSRIEIPGDTFEVKFLQWPAGSPDGRRLTFVAIGRLWIMDLPDGVPRPLAADTSWGFQLTPAWSPDGREIAFTSWHDHKGGQLWKVGLSGGAPQRLSRESGEYIHPSFSPDGRFIVVTKGPGPRGLSEWHGWNRSDGWIALRFAASGGAPQRVASLGAMRRASFGLGGRVYFPYQENVAATAGLFKPFPDSQALRQRVLVRSVDLNGGGSRDHVRFPPRRGRGNDPVISPDGRWVAFQAGRSIYVTPLGGAVADGEPPSVEPDPNLPVSGRVRVGEWGGVFHRWRDATTLEFVSGNRYVTHNAATGETRSQRILLKIPKPSPRGTIALTGAKIVTMEQGRVLENGTVVVTGSRIACVGTCDTSSADRVLDLRGKTIVPGFVDLHAHHTNEPSGVITQHRSSAALDLAYGVTTIVDPATDSESAFPLAEMTEAGMITGPRTFSSAEYVITPGFAWGDHVVIRTAADAQYHVNWRADWGAVTIKNYRQARRAQQQLLLQAARERGITVTSEGGPLYFDVALALDGQTGWEHFLGPLPIYRDAATFFGRAGMVYSPTVIVAGHVNGSKEYFRPLQGLESDPKYQRFIPRVQLMRVLRGARPIPKREVSFLIVAEGLADIVRAGGYGAIGEHGEQVGIGSHWEIWAYAEALTPLEALTVATLHGAYFIGAHEELGSIRVGKVTDLVVLNADPLQNIRNTANIAYVMKSGRLYDDDTLDEVWPERRPYGPVPWETRVP